MILVALLLAQADPAQADPARIAPPPVPVAPKVKCKSQPVIGSLAQTVKVCLTPAEWEAVRRGTQEDVHRIMDSAASARGN